MYSIAQFYSESPSKCDINAHTKFKSHDALMLYIYIMIFLQLILNLKSILWTIEKMEHFIVAFRFRFCHKFPVKNEKVM